VLAHRSMVLSAACSGAPAATVAGMLASPAAGAPDGTATPAERGINARLKDEKREHGRMNRSGSAKARQCCALLRGACTPGRAGSALPCRTPRTCAMPNDQQSARTPAAASGSAQRMLRCLQQRRSASAAYGESRQRPDVLLSLC